MGVGMKFAKKNSYMKRICQSVLKQSCTFQTLQAFSYWEEGSKEFTSAATPNQKRLEHTKLFSTIFPANLME